MKAIILAGGYGVRLQEDIKQLEKTDKGAYEHYKNFLNISKPLLPLEGKPLLNYIFDKLEKTEIKEAIIRTNGANYKEFKEWKKAYKGSMSIDIISDSLPENKYGQGVFGGVLFMLEKKNIKEEILILAGDTLFDYDLREVLEVYNKSKKTVIVAHKERPEFIRQRGVVQYDKDYKIIAYEEKPAVPKSLYAATPTFIFDSVCVQLISEYIAETKNDQNMGNIVPWLLAKGQEAYVHLTEKEIFDVGNVESVRLAEQFLADLNKKR